MAVVSMVVGATTATTATFVAKVDGGGPVRVAVSTTATMADPVYFGPESVDTEGVARVTATGLQADTVYWWQVEDNNVLDTTVTGRFRTHPPLGLPASFTLAAASCAGLEPVEPGVAGDELAFDRVSNHEVFDVIRAQDPLLFVHLGDMHYYDLGSGQHGISGGASLANYRAAYDDVLKQPRQAALYREIPTAYVWDDHDYGPDDSDGTHAGKAAAAQVYRERWPHYPLADSGGIWQAWQIGRVLCVLSDTRYYRSPNTDPDGPGKTMLGADQKPWLANLLSTSTAAALIWFMPSQWLGPSSDGWGSFTTERDDLVGLLDQYGWLRRTVMVHGDRHALRLDTGATNPAGGFPILCAASLDSSSGTALSGLGDVVDDTPGHGQWGLVQVDDHGSHLTIRLSAYRGTTLIGTYLHGVTVTAPVTPGALTRTLTGSHQILVEALALSTYQTGDEPDGVPLPVAGGQVTLDGTAEIRGTLELAVPGVDDDTALFPARADDPLSPYGAEVFIRYGVDLGAAGVLWTPLGYYRVDSADQADGPLGEITISGLDRMAGIIDARLLAPREFSPTRTVASVFAELVGEVYPDAVIQFDDESAGHRIGRVLVAEESRYEPLLELATSLGKILYWDGRGVLQVRTAPDESSPVWTVNAGPSGVLVRAGRRVSREGVYNAVVVVGEGGDSNRPVRAVAVDSNPASPTRWGGPFGKVPHFYHSSFISTVAQAQTAADELLRRALGTPASVDLSAVPNPALQPHDPIMVRFRDGTQELHIVDSVTIPLTPGEMRATTRRRFVAVIGSIT